MSYVCYQNICAGKDLRRQDTASQSASDPESKEGFVVGNCSPYQALKNPDQLLGTKALLA